MTIVADTGALYALYDADDGHHEAVERVVQESARERIVVPTTVVTELDYLLREHLGVAAELDFIDSLRSGAFDLEPLSTVDLDRCRQIVAQYRDLDFGIADASLIAIAERLGTLRLLTLDERDFRAVSSARGESFVLLPADR